MADDRHLAETAGVQADHERAAAEGLREEANRYRDVAERHRVLAESGRREAELYRALAEESRDRREQHRDEMDAVRHEREALRQASEEAREAAENARHATIQSVARTADALTSNLAQMQFLEGARVTLRRLGPWPRNRELAELARSVHRASERLWTRASDAGNYDIAAPDLENLEKISTSLNRAITKLKLKGAEKR
jgi:hypothetical protein